MVETWPQALSMLESSGRFPLQLYLAAAHAVRPREPRAPPHTRPPPHTARTRAPARAWQPASPPASPPLRASASVALGRRQALRARARARAAGDPPPCRARALFPPPRLPPQAARHPLHSGVVALLAAGHPRWAP